MTLALDISTSCIGYAIFREDGKLLEMNAISFSSKISYFERLTKFKDAIKHILDMGVQRIAMEEPLKKFKGKFSSAHTISVLNFFNGMVSSFLYSHFGIEPVYYNVNNARKEVFPIFKAKKDGASQKHQIWELVMRMEPQINWKYSKRSGKLQETNYDMTDAYVVGACDFVIVSKQKEKLGTE